MRTMYVLKINVPEQDRSDFRHSQFLPPGDPPIRCRTPEEVVRVLNSIVSTYTRKHRPGSDDIARMVERLNSAERGISIFRPSVPNSYRYAGRALRLELSHIWQGAECLVAASFHVGSLRKSPYGWGEMVWHGPNDVTEYEVWCNVDRSRALSMAFEWVASLERRFPGAAAIFKPDGLVLYRLPLEHYVFDDDGVMVLAVYYPHGTRILLGTPLGWFDTDCWTFDKSRVRSVYRLMKTKGIAYPRLKKARRWTDELALQIFMTFRFVAGGKKDEARGSVA